MALTQTVAERCVQIRYQHKIKLPDAIIAASALEINQPIVTRNIADFNKIAELKIINPFTAI